MMEKQKSIWTIIDDGVRTMYFFGSHNEPLEESANGELMALAMEYFVEAKKFKAIWMRLEKVAISRTSTSQSDFHQWWKEKDFRLI